MRSASTDSGRRVRLTVGARRTALFSATLVALTMVMLALAGTSPRDLGRPVEDPSRVLLDSRTFSCAGDISGAVVRSGSIRQGLDPDRAVPSGRSQPITVVAEQDVAAGAFAGQQVSSRDSLAWLPCPEPAARWWFVGAGGAENTHDTVFTISNPRPGEASVDIDVFGPGGVVDSPGSRDISIPPHGSRTIDLAKTAPALGNLAVSIRAKRGLVAVSAADRFAPGSIGAYAREWLPQQLLPARSITLAGVPVDRGRSSLMIANPNDVDAVVKVEVIGQTGTFTPEALREFIVGPGSVQTVSLSAVIDGTPLALKITSVQKITASVRSLKDGDTSFATGVRVIRGSTAFAVPDGRTQVLLSSLSEATTVRVIAFGAADQTLSQSDLPVAAQTTVRFALPAGTRYVRLVAADPTVIGGFVTVGRGGTTAAAISSAVVAVRLPKVRAGW